MLPPHHVTYGPVFGRGAHVPDDIPATLPSTAPHTISTCPLPLRFVLGCYVVPCVYIHAAFLCARALTRACSITCARTHAPHRHTADTLHHTLLCLPTHRTFAFTPFAYTCGYRSAAVTRYTFVVPFHGDTFGYRSVGAFTIRLRFVFSRTAFPTFTFCARYLSTPICSDAISAYAATFTAHHHRPAVVDPVRLLLIYSRTFFTLTACLLMRSLPGPRTILRSFRSTHHTLPFVTVTTFCCDSLRWVDSSVDLPLRCCVTTFVTLLRYARCYISPPPLLRYHATYQFYHHHDFLHCTLHAFTLHLPTALLPCARIC